MVEWWNNMTLLQQVLALIAIPSTLILVVQTVMVLITGGGGEGEDLDGDGIPDGDVDDGGLSLFSVRGIMGMLCIMGWSGVALLDTSLAIWLSMVIALLLGLATLLGLALLMKSVYRLQSCGNIDLGNAIGKVGQVYIPIPGGGNASGKVNVTVQEMLTECDAITTAPETLRTGSYVRVTAVSESGVLVVEPVSKP